MNSFSDCLPFLGPLPLLLAAPPLLLPEPPLPPTARPEGAPAGSAGNASSVGGGGAALAAAAAAGAAGVGAGAGGGSAAAAQPLLAGAGPGPEAGAAGRSAGPAPPACCCFHWLLASLGLGRAELQASQTRAAGALTRVQEPHCQLLFCSARRAATAAASGGTHLPLPCGQTNGT